VRGGVLAMFPGKLCVFGGDGRQSAECFDHLTDVWKALPEMLCKRVCPAVCSAGEFIYVCGGIGLHSVERLNLSSATWERMPRMHQARTGAVAAQLAGCIYVCGGASEAVLNSVECFDPKRSSWTDAPRMQFARYGASGVVCKRQLIVCGGRGTGDAFVAEIESFDPVRDRWEVLTKLPTPRSGVAVAATCGKMFVCGGSTGDGPRAHGLPLVQQYNFAEQIWETLPPLTQGRFDCAACVIDGCLFVCGGGHLMQSWSSSEIFDPVSRSWKSAPPMIEQRCGMGAAISRFACQDFDEESEESGESEDIQSFCDEECEVSEESGAFSD